MNTKNQNSGASIQGNYPSQDKFGSPGGVAQGSVGQGSLGESNRAQGSLGQSSWSGGGQSKGESAKGSQGEFGEVDRGENIEGDYIGPTGDLGGAVEVEASLDQDDIDDSES